MGIYADMYDLVLNSRSPQTHLNTVPIINAIHLFYHLVSKK